MAYRASYGADFYGTGLYGVTGAIDGSATVTVTSSVSASAQVVKGKHSYNCCKCKCYI